MKSVIRTPRRGFTLVEVLVAAGLSMLIMVMVTTAFQKGMDTLSQLKSVGEMQQKLRAFEQVVTSDLQADHFDGKYGPKVSDQRLDKVWYPNPPTAVLPAITNDVAGWRPPTRGFFRLVTPTTNNVDIFLEGTDPQGNPSTRAVSHIMAMTVRRNAARGDKLFTSKLPANVKLNAATMAKLTPSCLSQMNVTPDTMNSDWAEVVYFLDTQNPVGSTKGGTPLYGLYRRVRVLPGSGNPTGISAQNEIFGAASATERDLVQGLSMQPGLVYGVANPNRPVNSPESVRNPRHRLGGLLSDRAASTEVNNQWDYIAREQVTGGTQPTGSDLLLTDVISFEIKADWDVPAGSAIRPPATSIGGTTYEFPFNYLPAVEATRNPKLANRRIFDTWYDTTDNPTAPVPSTVNSWVTVGTENTIPNPIRLRAVQIKVRVWDRKNNMARQITIIQDL